MKVAEIQRELRKQGLDGWLFFDHHGRDPLAYRILGLPPAQHVTRRWYYLIPATGDPIAIVHRIEYSKLDSLVGEKRLYSAWLEHTAQLQRMLSGIKKVAMQYSPLCAIPYVSMVDAGTIELVAQLGCEVVSSAELVQQFEATLSVKGLDSHREAGRLVDLVRANAFQLITERVRSSALVTELEVADYIKARCAALDLVAENSPIVAVNSNSGDPHYQPTSDRSTPIKPGDFVLIDMWARLNQEDSVYYDITWTGFCGERVPEQIVRVFEIVRSARDAAVHKIRTSWAASEQIMGYEVDDAARSVVTSHGFGPNFIHRTGHSIGHDVHGSGANMDNYECHDERKLLPWTCFSIEPGIYLNDFGVRSELNVFLTDTEVTTNGEVQQELVRMF